MRKIDTKKYKKLLLERRQAIVDDIKGLREETTTTTKEATGDLSHYSYHMADLGTDAQEREKKFMLAHKSGRFLHHIDEALHRIEDGTYGKCHICDKPINKPRLEAVPHARMCIKCKEEEEQKKQRQRR